MNEREEEEEKEKEEEEENRFSYRRKSRVLDIQNLLLTGRGNQSKFFVAVRNGRDKINDKKKLLCDKKKTIVLPMVVKNHIKL